ncbi:MAG: superinfection immunity protein [Oscillospiraceae bacterium]|nr:superinfection immunity protein [Oscillospiraceae bacterium]
MHIMFLLSYAGYIAYFIAGIIAVIGLTQTQRAEKNENIYGVNINTGVDEIFKKTFKKSLIITIVGAIVSLLVLGYILTEVEGYNFDDFFGSEYMGGEYTFQIAKELPFPYNEIVVTEHDFYEGISIGGYILFMCIVPLIAIGIYFIFFLPVKLARRYAHEQTTIIAWLTFLFGGTLIVWIAMLIWANSRKPLNTPTVVQIANGTNQTSADKIKDLKKLFDEGLITQEEFEEKRKELISEM